MGASADLLKKSRNQTYDTNYSVGISTTVCLTIRYMWKRDRTEAKSELISSQRRSRGTKGFWSILITENCFKDVKGVWDSYSEKHMNKDLLISFGFGDGGGGVNRDMLEYRRRMDKIPGLPNVKISTAGEYFRKLHETVEQTNQYVHTWDGELYLEYHRGTYTSQAYNKRMNRRMELLYRRAEWLTVMEALLAGNIGRAKQKELTKGWKHILTDQFHDIIPGSSIHEVYEDSREDYAYIEGIDRRVRTEACEYA